LRILLVEVHIKPDKREEFLAAITENAASCERDEPGCLRFDVLQDNTDPNTYFYYEVYRDDDAVKAHFEAPHFFKYRDAAKDVIENQVAHRLSSVFPVESGWSGPRA